MVLRGIYSLLRQVTLPTMSETISWLDRPSVSLARSSFIHPFSLRSQQKCDGAKATAGNQYFIQLNSFGSMSKARQALFQKTESLLEEWKHPDPYRPPTAPGGKSFATLEAEIISSYNCSRIEVWEKPAGSHFRSSVPHNYIIMRRVTDTGAAPPPMTLWSNTMFVTVRLKRECFRTSLF